MRVGHLVTALLLCGGSLWASNLVQDFSFESPDVSSSNPPGQFQYRPTGTAWTFVLSSGISGAAGANNGFDLVGGIPDGSQVAYIQRANSQIYQTVTGLTSGDPYYVTFYYAARPNTCPNGTAPACSSGGAGFFGGGEDFELLWNNVQILTVGGSYSTSFAQASSDTFIAGSSGTLMFQGLDANSDASCTETSAGQCDRTAFIDAVVITQGVNPDAPVVPEPSSSLLLISGIALALGLRRKLHA